MRKTKIVCTIGPASQSVEVLEKLIKAGMNVARLNMAHGSHDYHRDTISNVRKASANLGIPVAILMDIKGPELRIGEVGEEVLLEDGQTYTLTSENVVGDKERVSINYPSLVQDIGLKEKVLIDDGLIRLEVQDKTSTDIICKVIVGGELKSRKGVNLPGTVINLPSLTEKDQRDLLLAIEEKLDFIAASFIQRASDVLQIRAFLEEHRWNMDIISKIESGEGVRNIEEIIRASDGIMVARGDLGVQVPAEEVPLMQKLIIKKCNEAGKPVITATQMLDSMIRNPMPTRAEATDVANAIFDGTDAIMLSGETAAGKYPMEAVATMNKIARRTEAALPYEDYLKQRTDGSQRSVPDAISHATCQTARDLGVAAIVTATSSGHTAQMVSRYKPKAPIVAVTPEERIVRKLQLVWGVYALKIIYTKNTDEMLKLAVEGALQSGLVKNGEMVVITAGVPVGIQGSTNLLKVQVIGEVLAKGVGIGSNSFTGRVKVAISPGEALEKIEEGDILVTVETDIDFMPIIPRVGAIITEEGGLTSHAAIVGIEKRLPVVVSVPQATNLLKDGDVVTVDSRRGLIYAGEIHVL